MTEGALYRQMSSEQVAFSFGQVLHLHTLPNNWGPMKPRFGQGSGSSFLLCGFFFFCWGGGAKVEQTFHGLDFGTVSCSGQLPKPKPAMAWLAWVQWLSEIASILQEHCGALWCFGYLKVGWTSLQLLASTISRCRPASLSLELRRAAGRSQERQHALCSASPWRNAFEP